MQKLTISLREEKHACDGRRKLLHGLNVLGGAAAALAEVS